jgi:hypothetical protein
MKRWWIEGASTLLAAGAIRVSGGYKEPVLPWPTGPRCSFRPAMVR